VRGKNFLVNYSELRNLGEGKNLSKMQNTPTTLEKEYYVVVGESNVFTPKGCEK
jgi:hypothetical protein